VNRLESKLKKNPNFSQSVSIWTKS
jgi:hypothetical protein